MERTMPVRNQHLEWRIEGVYSSSRHCLTFCARVTEQVGKNGHVPGHGGTWTGISDLHALIECVTVGRATQGEIGEEIIGFARHQRGEE
jgi:hypothetical protein